MKETIRTVERIDSHAVIGRTAIPGALDELTVELDEDVKKTKVDTGIGA